MYRDGSWPIDELRVIGSLENLVTLDVILNLLTRDKKPAHPFLNTNSARELLHCVNSGMTRKKSPLELFQIETGAPAIPEFSSTPVIRKQCDAFRPQENMYTQWVRSQSEMICVRPSGRSEMTWTAGIDVHCPALDQVERKLRRRGIPMEQWIENDEYSRRKRRADIGPINYEEWEAENEKQAATGEKYSL
ncbi:hypothetical protein EV356DRAFT_515853 [Viridothelium virens]|uniref:Uncharacterized protein n=1 Tax=Viridothelium virens TaxID=1048519 RepID=A0A6A6H7T9_VIRVR|nr:hypothetical protein EV356DRAFT_515853 [Viridothelium virens]